MIELIIWDYNGTVIDDVDTTVASVNEMLARRGLEPTNKAVYTENLVMPLEKYYATVGIYNADISTLSIEFHKGCLNNESLSHIFNDFIPAISKSKALGISNILLSSLYDGFLSEEVNKYDIREYFDFICGMKDTSVGSKTDNAKNYLIKNGINPKNVLFIGDLLSDAQTAKEIGANCILVSRGHCSHSRLEKTGLPVFTSLEKALDFALSVY